MKRINNAAKRSMMATGITIIVYLGVLFLKPDPHVHADEGLEIMGHDDHIHVVYRPVFELSPASINSIVAYFPELQTQVQIFGRAAQAGQMVSSCREMREWATQTPADYLETELSEREARELRNLYSKITPDFRITSPPPGETYGLQDPAGCVVIQTEEDRIFLQFGRESAQGFSRYMRVNGGEQIYIVSRYFYTTLTELIAEITG
ncbi:MAG: DUF4340 domain-containing protein [Balneolaceae bacterium]|nr:MAG: DUF4340 domain-containing protein [Balneolaceae bacterium]